MIPSKAEKLAEARGMKVNELKAALKERGLSQQGLKAVLLERLEKAIEADPEDSSSDGLVTPNVVTAQQIATEKNEGAKESEATKVEEMKPVEESPAAVAVAAATTTTTPIEEEKKSTADRANEPIKQVESNKEETKPVAKSTDDKTTAITKEVEMKPVKEMEKKEDLVQSESMQVETKQPDEQKEDEKKRKREENNTSEQPTEKEREDKKVKKDETTTPATSSTPTEPPKTTRTVLSSGPPVQPFLSALTSAARSTARQPRQQEPRVVPPSSRPQTNTLLITGFVRPLNTKKVTNMLEGKGRKTVDFWMNDIKTHCYVTFASEEQAAQLREEVYGLVWPEDNPDAKALHAEFVPSDALNRAKNGGLLEQHTEDRAQKRPVLLAQRGIAAAVGAVQSPVKKEVTVTNPDKLFHRTQAQPSIYYLPLTPKQIEEKRAETNNGTKR